MEFSWQIRFLAILSPKRFFFFLTNVSWSSLFEYPIYIRICAVPVTATAQISHQSLSNRAFPLEKRPSKVSA